MKNTQHKCWPENKTLTHHIRSTVVHSKNALPTYCLFVTTLATSRPATMAPQLSTCNIPSEPDTGWLVPLAPGPKRAVPGCSRTCPKHQTGEKAWHLGLHLSWHCGSTGHSLTSGAPKSLSHSTSPWGKAFSCVAEQLAVAGPWQIGATAKWCNSGPTPSTVFSSARGNANKFALLKI